MVIPTFQYGFASYINHGFHPYFPTQYFPTGPPGKASASSHSFFEPRITSQVSMGISMGKPWDFNDTL
jgi:hypothetical protein